MAPSDLETRAAAGDADARFALGTQLMAQAGTFETFGRAAALIEASSSGGHAGATCLLATLEAVGAGRTRDWDRALGLLERAAEQGSEHAIGQLRLLEGMSRADSDTGPADESDWRGARGRIDLAVLLAAPPPRAISERPRLRLFEGFARPAECSWVIDRLRPKLEAAVIWDMDSGETLVDPYRSNRAAGVALHDMDVVIAVLRARISTATRLPEFIFELAQLMHYEVGQEFLPHHDFIDPDRPGFVSDLARRGQRIGTFLLYLNDDFEGGSTDFPEAGLSVRGQAGDGLFFANVLPDGRPDRLTLHAGRSPTRGEKWILSQWIRDRPPAEAGSPA